MSLVGCFVGFWRTLFLRVNADVNGGAQDLSESAGADRHAICVCAGSSGDARYRSATRAVPSGFSYDLSTEDNYCRPHFVGKYKDIRPLLDYTYHRLFSEARCKVQDDIIDGFLQTANEAHIMPWVVFTAGAMGAGKGFTMKWMHQQGYFPLDNFVTVDPDAIRQALPEWNGYVKRDPSSAAALTHKEAGMIAELLGFAALRCRRNVIIDGSLRDTEWYTTYFADLRKEFPGVRIAIIHIVAKAEEVLARAASRGRATGRHVPLELLESSMQAVPRSVNALAKYADFVCRVLNSDGQKPQIQREPEAPYPPEELEVTWDLFQHLWHSIDTDGDGVLSAEEVQAALAKGSVTFEALQTIDTNGDGQITLDEIEHARLKAAHSGTRIWK